MSISGWNSNAQVTVHATSHNGHVSQYSCKARDLSLLCSMLDREALEGLVRSYRVACNNAFQGPDYFGFTDSYPKWVAPALQSN